MDYQISAQDRAAFKRCRRQWDLGCPQRQNLQAVHPPPPDLSRAVRDALAVYYYPGMWEWDSHIVLPLVRKAFMRTIAAAPAPPQPSADLDAGAALLERYFAWAPTVDDFAPLKIETDVQAIVADIRQPGRGLLAGDGRRVLYTDRIPLLAVDAADECWVVTHDVVPDWGDVESLLLDEAAVAACWAWEQTYLGMHIAGTIHNEILRSPPDTLGQAPVATRTGRMGRGGFSQNEPSGGGRSIPQLERSERRGYRPPRHDRVEQETAGVLRRTRIRRTGAEIETITQQIGAEALEMLNPELALYPTPSPAHCPRCAFAAPCLSMTEGADPALDLAAGFARGPAVPAYQPRLGSGGAGGRIIAMPPPS